MFQIYNREDLVGWSELELGDPPMGIAFGKFIPAENYGNIQPLIVGGSDRDREKFNLSVRLPNGEPLECVGVGIEDQSAEFGDEGREVTVLGISYPQYEKLFPHHVAAYEKKLSGRGAGS